MDAKSPSYNPFANYPDFPASKLHPSLPVEYRHQLRSLLPHLDAPKVSNLVNSHRDSAGRTVHGMPVINRPWEWIENLGEPIILDPKTGHGADEDARSKARYVTKNSGSLSLDIFGAQLTGDGISPRESVDAPECNLWAFEDGLSAENIFKREWRETRVPTEFATRALGGGVGDEAEFDIPFQYAASRADKRPSSRGSSASSVVSRTSARGSVGPGWLSPAQGTSARQLKSTMNESIEVTGSTAVSSRSLNKRKAAAVPAVDSDDEIEIVDGPLPTHVGTSKKARGKAPSKAKSKRK